MQTIQERASELVRKMTLEEKAAQLSSAWLEINEDGTFSVKETSFSDTRPQQLKESVLGIGIGQITRPYGTQAKNPRSIAKGINEIQRYLVQNTRLGIPAMLHEECLTGAMVVGSTIFPASLNTASTWDIDLMERIGRAIGKELSSLGVHQGLAPVLDVARDARWGRTEETFGEDPYLVGNMGIAYVNGLQGTDCSPIATLKHFLGHSFSEGGRNHAPVHMGERELLNTFALPFEMVVKGANAGSVMPAYHDIDGQPCSSSHHLLSDILRKQWGFKGIVVADYEAPAQLLNDHKVAADLAQAAAMAVQAGMDLELPSGTTFKQGLVQAVNKGYLAIEDLDAAVLRVLHEKFRLGLFENPYIDSEGILLNSKESHSLAVEAATKSLVLLKNDGLLPLHPKGKIAVIGPLANHPKAMYNGYSAPIHLQGSKGSENTIPKNAKTIKSAIEEAAPEATILYEPGCMLYENKIERAVFFPGDVIEDDSKPKAELSTNTSRIEKAVEVALQADTVVLVVGDMVGLFQTGTVGEGSDVSSLTLPGVQQQLLEAILETGKPVVVVLVSGRPYDLQFANEKASSILATWLCGEGGGEAIANVLFAKANPSGKTPLSFPRCAGSLPYAYNHTPKAGGFPRQREYGALFPFGFGLSYTQFSYENCMVDRQEITTQGEVRISATIANTGMVAGDEIVQLYIHDAVASIVRPVKELKGFARISLQPGEKSEVTFVLPSDMLSFVVDGIQRIVEPGTFEIMIGKSCEEIVWRQEIFVTGTVRTLEKDWKFKTPILVKRL
ncbi:beta-glucosidase-like glycosyl hydrolase [Sphaerochaeta pleomorpha str. Grapes]|uniref:Beta-glucosidase-like glycosyl hydrolase n=1 Tax=Sphaerochaeta pleomorpha (strain ATCC BAA-1885 / DSM 22778 / Grapes) TaxID=158190 RepID=G8QUC6_SPHPG|nr:glycoside hydrolase family 3 N-terminal domain-containing protein [Sphaerochaeta pleomorpha]AEV28096.1 beta-glucosidase-like glycosyl hydrolase [Sphaerochaeta pleomorpha str. Grapes]